MALVLGRFSGSVTPASLASILGIRGKKFTQFIFHADVDNVGKVWLGPSTVDAAGANATGVLGPDDQINMGPSEEPFTVDTDHIFAVSGGAGEELFLITNTDDRG